MKKLYSKLNIYLKLNKHIQGKKIFIQLEDDITRATYETHTHAKLHDKPKPKGTHRIRNSMPTTKKVISQVQCQACNKSMSAKKLRYSHAA